MRTTRSSDQIDPGGKKIDLFPPREFLRTFVFDDCDQIQARIFELTLDALLEIANSNRKRVRERELPVWSGRMSNRMDMKLFIVGLPYELHFPVFQTFEKRFSEDPSFAEISYSPGEEFDAAPFVRYEFGNLIWYGDPFSKAEEVTSPSRTGVKFEIRSWKPVPTRRKIYSATNKPELPERKSPRFHSQEVWEENREAILNFVYGLKGPCRLQNSCLRGKKAFRHRCVQRGFSTVCSIRTYPFERKLDLSGPSESRGPDTDSC